MTVVSRALVAFGGSLPDLLKGHAVESTFPKGFQHLGSNRIVAVELDPALLLLCDLCSDSGVGSAANKPADILSTGKAYRQAKLISNLGNRLERKSSGTLSVCQLPEAKELMVMHTLAFSTRS